MTLNDWINDDWDDTMKKDWFTTFLPVWMWGAIAWITVGFIELPDAYRSPLFGRTNAIYLGRSYEATELDYAVLWRLLVVLGVPNLVLVVALAIAGYQHIRAKPKNIREPSRG